MKIGMIGLGRMGGNMVRRLIQDGHQCVCYDLNPENVRVLANEGGIPAFSLNDLVKKLPPSRVLWLMLPAGKNTEEMIRALSEMGSAEDIIVDGGNSYFKDSVRHALLLKERGIHFVDVGTSGGLWGLKKGYCLMAGGEAINIKTMEPIFRTLGQAFLHCGPAGAGHFVKMVHNGIEYGMMQALAEGFDLLKNADRDTVDAPHRYSLRLDEIAEVWRHGSVISSWLLDLLAQTLKEDAALTHFEGYVHDSGEGRWTVQTALEEEVSLNVLTSALYSRYRSRRDHTFGEKVLSAMRYGFGGHTEK